MPLVRPASLLVFVAACSAGGAGPVPAQHRPKAVSCPSNDMPSAMACTSDAQCNSATPGAPSTTSAYCLHAVCGPDQCRVDSDCPSEQVCSCAGATRGYAGASPGNVCVPGNCRTDADCGPGGYCSPTVSATCGAFYGVQGYYCHKPGDACTNDSDCPGSASGIKPYCAYDPASGRWACGMGACAG